MQPSTQQPAPSIGIGRLPAGLLALVVVAGSASLFATYWDDAWHTDLGRDQALIPLHLLLYGSMAVIGAVMAAWGLSALRRSRSLAAVLGQPPLLLAAAGGAVTLAALPIDAAWHAAFGRDAVLWSPPHMLAPSSAASPCWWALLLVAGAVALSPAAADAHDPGQGHPIAPVTLTGTSDGRGTITITADSANDCAALPPRRVVARRAGRIVTGALTATGHCRYAGQVHVPATGRWFVAARLPPGSSCTPWERCCWH